MNPRCIWTSERKSISFADVGSTSGWLIPTYYSKKVWNLDQKTYWIYSEGATHAANERLEAGDARVLVRLHLAGILRDATRAALVTALGLGLGQLARALVVGALTVRGVTLLDVAAVSAGIAAGAAGTLRLVGRGPGLRWFAAGVVGGAAVVWLR